MENDRGNSNAGLKQQHPYTSGRRTGKVQLNHGPRRAAGVGHGRTSRPACREGYPQPSPFCNRVEDCDPQGVLPLIILTPDNQILAFLNCVLCNLCGRQGECETSSPRQMIQLLPSTRRRATPPSPPCFRFWLSLLRVHVVAAPCAQGPCGPIRSRPPAAAAPTSSIATPMDEYMPSDRAMGNPPPLPSGRRVRVR